MKVSDIKKILSPNNIRQVLEGLGYEFSRSGHCKIRQERTPSSHINPKTGYITDFGSGWSGDIFDLLTEYHGLEFKEAMNYVAGELGLSEGDIEVGPAPVFTSAPQKPKYDVKRIYERFSKGRGDFVKRVGHEEAARRLTEELLPKSLQKGIDRRIVDEMVGYDPKNESFTVSLLEGEEVKAVTIQRFDGGKWKTYGQKCFIATHITDEPIAFVVYGMKEILLLQTHHWPFIGFQADGIAKSIERNEQAVRMKKAVKGKVMALLLDNDDSCRATVEPLRRHFSESVVVAVDFQKMLFDKTLPKGYDFYDFAVWCGSMEMAYWMIADYIEMVPPYDINRDEASKESA